MCTILSRHKLGNIIRISRSTVSNFRHYKPILTINSSNLITNECQRQFSFQTTVESLAKSQASIFKWLSESTPVEYAQNFLLSVHDTTGLPWWATIICTTVLVRTTVTLPLAIYQYYILAKLENIKLEMPAIAKEMQMEMAVAIKMYKWDEKTARATYNRSMRQQWTKLIERENCHPLKTSILLLFQIPLWISISIALRNLVYMLPNSSSEAEITYLELTLGGFGFIPNLAVADSSLIFPFLLGILNLGIIEFQCMSKVDPPSKPARIITNIFRGLSILMVPIAASVPSCLVLYWTTSSAYGLIQNVFLISPKVRRLCKIPKTAKELEKPYEHISHEIIKRCNKFKIFNSK